MAWREIELGSVATFINGYAFKPKDWENMGLPIIRIQNLTNTNSKYNYYSGEYDTKYEVNYGDILISWSASLGVFQWRGEKALLNQHIFKVVFDKIDIDKVYFRYVVSQAIREMEKYTHGSTMKHITKRFFDKIKIPLPPLETQKKIADVLDKAQELIDKRKEQLEKLDEFVQSVFLDMFGDPADNLMNWECHKLKEVAIKITDGTHNSPPMADKGIPYITAKHVKSTGVDFFIDPTYISKEDHERIFARCNPEKGDVLYIKDGVTTGIAAINHYDFEFSILSSLALIKLDKTRINNYYLTHYLNNPIVKKQVTNNMAGGAIKRLTLTKIKEIEILNPPLTLQNKFAQVVEKTEQQKQLMQQSLTEMENNFNSLMQRAFRGELF